MAKTLPPIRPNEGLRARYQRRLEREVAEMQADVLKAMRHAYGSEMAQDASPAVELAAALRRLRRNWLRRFDRLADVLARYFAQDAAQRVDAVLTKALRDAGFTVRFTWTRPINTAVQAVMAENVALIKSIPEQYMTAVEGDVMRSVQMGRDLGALTRDLQANYGVSKRRAAIIARDQNNKATAVVVRTRQQELGITEAVWLHSGGGKTPRPTHVAFSGKRYKIADGVILDPREGVVWPGTAVNCRCVCKAVIPALEGLTPHPRRGP